MCGLRVRGLLSVQFWMRMASIVPALLDCACATTLAVTAPAVPAPAVSADYISEKPVAGCFPLV